MFGEPVKRPRPATLVIIAPGGRLEPGLVKDKPGLAPQIGTGDGDEGLGTGIVRSVVRNLGQDDPLGCDDLTVDAVLTNEAAVRCPHRARPGTARPHVHPAGNRGSATRSPPTHEVLRIGPQFEGERARRVEDPRNDKLAIGGEQLGQPLPASSLSPLCNSPRYSSSRSRLSSQNWR